MKMARLLSLMLALLLLLSLAPASALAEEKLPGEKPDSYAVEAVTYPYLWYYANDTEPKESEMTLYFVNGGDIPYVALNEYMAYLGAFLQELDKGEINYEVSALSDTLFMATRPDNYSTLYVDTEEDTLFFLNLNGFTNKVGVRAAVTILDLPDAEPMDVDQMASIMVLFEDLIEDLGDETVGAELEEFSEDMEGEGDTEVVPRLFDKGGFSSMFYYNRAGDTVEFNLDDYMIDLVAVDGVCYLPLQTMNDLFLSKEYMQVVFTGEQVMCFSYNVSAAPKYSVPTGSFSEDFALFNYNELRFLMDAYYGLKPEHNIKDFGTLMALDTGLITDLTGTDPRKFDLALMEVTFTYMDDGHSGFMNGSVLAGPNDLDKYVTILKLGPSSMASVSAAGKFESARKAVYGDNVPFYEEVGDTAFITFDGFSQLREDDEYYTAEMDPENPLDTIELIMYANRQIKREDSPVKNIVLDLSNNGGGSASAAVFVISWFLGDANIALRDTLTGAQTNMAYNCDVDLDGAYDAKKDTVSTDYNLYCMTSVRSFSCGNLVPAACKASGKVTMIGQTSGGGSCVVLPCTTASGALFCMSGPFQLATIKNGSFYNVDTGVTPDVVLTRPESFYDREGLAEYLSQLK